MVSHENALCATQHKAFARSIAGDRKLCKPIQTRVCALRSSCHERVRQSDGLFRGRDADHIVHRREINSQHSGQRLQQFYKQSSIIYIYFFIWRSFYNQFFNHLLMMIIIKTFDVFQPPFDKFLTSLKDDEWRSLRRIVGTTFTLAKLKQVSFSFFFSNIYLHKYYITYFLYLICMKMLKLMDVCSLNMMKRFDYLAETGESFNTRA